MNEICPVCKRPYSGDAEKCEECGFIKLHRTFRNTDKSNYRIEKDSQTARSYWDVILTSPGLTGVDRVKVIKVMRELTGYALQHLLDVTNNVPSPVVRGVTNDVADQIRAAIARAGANVMFIDNPHCNEQLNESIIRQLEKLEQSGGS